MQREIATMPKHVWMMWLTAGGGALLGMTLTYLATRPMLAPTTGRARSGWRRLRSLRPLSFMTKRRTASATPVGLPSTGNVAFDEYRDTQLASLEREAREFRSFLQRLRDARDRQEFDAFLREKKTTPAKAPVVIDNG